LLGQVAAAMEARGAHPARTVVLLPYAQLMPVARRAWAARRVAGFVPRFETFMNWAGAHGFAPGDEDIAFDMGRDLLTARLWLDRAGLGAQAAVLAGRLVEAAWQAAAPAAAVLPAERPAWAARARPLLAAGMEAPQLALESAVARIAVEWAAASGYATDVLLSAATLESLDLLVVLEGLQREPLADALLARMGARALALPLAHAAPVGAIALHEADDPAQEAEMAAACVVRHLEAGRAPVALAAIDRVLTRRIRAMLGARGVAVRDETGWKLSTTRAAAHVMGALRACAWNASSDAALDWLKNAPAVASGTALALERRIRRNGLRDWAQVVPQRLGSDGGSVAALLAQANGWRGALQAPRALPAWQQALRELLQATGHWPALVADEAGAPLLAVLGLHPDAQADWARLPQAARRMSLADFTHWTSEALEAASFVPQAPDQEQVVVLPFHQLLGRSVGAVVIPGCDESRLAPSPEPAGAWTAAQRAVLGLPAREALEQAQRAGWQQALQLPQVDLLWRRSDDSGEPVLPSPLVQQLRMAGFGRGVDDPRAGRLLAVLPVERPLAVAAQLPVDPLSASAYEDLRRCPYRFFALRQLGLQEAAEIDAELDKRDFGNWLHQVLRAFHEALQQDAAADRRALLDACAERTTASLALAEGEFLPFAAAWPQARDGYLAWLAGHEAKEGARFEAAEGEHRMTLGPVRLLGRIDRVDRLPDGRRMVIDYKTEALQASGDRLKVFGEDTQLAFYAALLEDDTVRAAYVNVGERGETKTVEHADVVAARDALVDGILDDLRRVGDGAALPALGEGRVCEFCAARGLCRRDFWHG
jgi:ATP-dependent helicase/nuclease subunit B